MGFNSGLRLWPPPLPYLSSPPLKPTMTGTNQALLIFLMGFPTVALVQGCLYRATQVPWHYHPIAARSGPLLP